MGPEGRKRIWARRKTVNLNKRNIPPYDGGNKKNIPPYDGGGDGPPGGGDDEPPPGGGDGDHVSSSASSQNSDLVFRAPLSKEGKKVKHLVDSL